MADTKHRLIRLRKAKGLSAYRLAREAGVSLTHVLDLEAGNRVMQGPCVMCRIARVLGVGPEELLACREER